MAGLVAVLALAGLAGCTGSQAVDPQAGGARRFVQGSGTVSEYAPADRKPLPAVRGTLLGGGTLDLADLRGKVVVLNFWGSWCAPCRAEAQTLEEVYQATKASGVAFVGVNVRDSESKAKAFNRTFGVTYPSLFDEAGRVAISLREAPPNAIPATILIDRAGRVAMVFRKPLLMRELRPAVDRLAAEPG
ncbi:MAG TPA: TlpA disulfide reductase family protein [Cryptosporangiaceae bacterium]|nr:TlpA disulfide reductase family protein [Cryptosporangiaceae bacterium]